ncbi:unnamed protein product [Cylicocyclus nassatus]|uniref:Uncharacterized protein n=1 Tax=Cylicocyclus nassatus TaxID=53992 RepID=A0AA36HEA7_CYLNA|nr:unnamed protein product [Cylicocyclus nassatus]
MASASLFVVLLFEAHFTISTTTSQKQQYDRQVYEIDTAKLRRFWHTGTILGVIKTYTKSMLAELPHVERVVYDICSRDAKSIVDLAKCSVRVFNTRDALKSQQVITSSTQTTSTVTSTKSTTSPTLSSPSIQNSPFKVWMDNDLPTERKKAKIFRSSPWTLNDHKSRKVGNRIKFKFDLEDERSLNFMTSPSFRILSLHPSKKRVDKNKPNRREKADPFGPLHRRKGARSLRVRSWRKRTKRNAFDADKSAKFGSRKMHISTGLTTDLSRLADIYNGNHGTNAGEEFAPKQMREIKQSQPTSHIDKLLLIRDHFQRVKECNNYFDSLNEQNRKFFEQFKLGIDSQAPTVEKQAASVMDGVVQTINAFTSQTSSDKLSLFSPRLLSLLPEPSIPNHKKVLSPTMFSFQKEGILSLPELFKIAAISKEEQNDLLELIMDLSGAGKALQDVLTSLQPEIEEILNIKFPLVQELLQHDKRWTRSRASFTREQNKDYDEKGYAFLDEEQLNLIYTPEDQLRYGMNTTKLGRLTRQEKMARVEKNIRELAALDKPRGPSWGSARVKRQANEGPINWVTLSPTAFAVHVLGGASMDIITLSPRAFIVDVLWPSALIQETLSPRVFIVAILSPNALIARIISPTAFRVEVLSPRALVAWVLSPQAFLAQILTPNILNPNVLNPDTFVLQLLSPAIISPGAGSPTALNAFVLSPAILSPRLLSGQYLVLEILSPHILGGEHTEWEAHRGVAEVGGYGGAYSPHYHGNQFVQGEPR